MVTLSHAGYAKSQPVTEYQAQRRGGRGKAATAVKDEDFVEKLFVAHTHDTMLCFSNRGKVYWKTRVRTAAGGPRLARQAHGQPAAAGRGREDQRRAAHQAVRRRSFRVHGHQPGHGQEDAAVGVLAAARQRHHRASTCDDDDRLVGVALTDGTREIILSSSGGKSIRFNEEEVRPMGREATGVRGIKLGDGQELISLIVVGEGYVLTASANGYGKLTPLEDFPPHGRGGQGVIALQTTDRNGEMVAALQVNAEHELMLISSTGTLVRTPVGRNLRRRPQYAGRAPHPAG